MNSKLQSHWSRGRTWGALVAFLTFAFIGAMVWKLIQTRGLWGWPALWGFAALGIVVVVVILHEKYEIRRIRRAVAEALRGRPPLTDDAFGRPFCEPAVASVASRLRCLLAEHLDCDLAGMVPSDDFESWLDLSSGPDSAADGFFEELAIEFRLRRDSPWPKRFESFDALVRFVVANAPGRASVVRTPAPGTSKDAPPDIATTPPGTRCQS